MRPNGLCAVRDASGSRGGDSVNANLQAKHTAGARPRRTPQSSQRRYASSPTPSGMRSGCRVMRRAGRGSHFTLMGLGTKFHGEGHVQVADPLVRARDARAALMRNCAHHAYRAGRGQPLKASIVSKGVSYLGAWSPSQFKTTRLEEANLVVGPGRGRKHHRRSLPRCHPRVISEGVFVDADSSSSWHARALVGISSGRFRTQVRKRIRNHARSGAAQSWGQRRSKTYV